MALTACGGGDPRPTATVTAIRETPVHSEALVSQPAPESASSTPSPATELAALRWYEVLRIHDLEGVETRSLIFGSLDGRYGGELPLGSISFEEREGGAEPFAWIDPQAGGVFAGQALVWGRDGQLGRLEAIDLSTGNARVLAEADGVIHVATADAALAHVFFVTAEQTGKPTGLWVDDARDEDLPERLAYDFGDQRIHNFSRLSLAANADGSLLAVQRDDGSATVVDVGRGTSSEVDAGGPVIGFTGDYLVSFGQQSRDGTHPLRAFARSGAFTAVQGAVAAQIVSGGRGNVLAVMTVDGSSYDVYSASLDSREVAHMYRGDVGSNPLLASRERSPVGYEAPPDTVLLVESFARFIGEPPPGRELPSSAYPLLLNVQTGATHTLGPWEPDD